MKASPEHADREIALRVVETRLAAEPGALALRLERARLLTALGRNEEARLAYLAILDRFPHDATALNDLGTLLYVTGARTAARMAFAEAVSHHPDDPAGHVNLADTFIFESRFETARAHYEHALRLQPDNAKAHQGLAYLFAELGDEDAAQRHRDAGFAGRAVITGAYRGVDPPVRVLQLTAASGGNVATYPLLDDTVFATTTLVVEYLESNAPLPEHDVVFNAIGDADRCRRALEAAQRLVRHSDAPVLNDPDAVLATGRVQNAARLRALEGVVAPRMHAFRRGDFAGGAPSGFAYPFLLRAPGFHAGRYFVAVNDAAQLEVALAEIPGDELLAIEYLDARGEDGLSRKYRAIIVGETIYPLHLAIASEWKLHYMMARMAEHPERQAEEARFLDDLPAALGPRAAAALERIRRTLALDYGGMDFALDKNGNVLLFEANATMVVLRPEQHEAWAAYRRPAVERIMAAFREMLRAAARERRAG